MICVRESDIWWTKNYVSAILVAAYARPAQPKCTKISGAMEKDRVIGKASAKLRRFVSNHSEKACLSRPNELPKNDSRLAMAISFSCYIHFVEAAGMGNAAANRYTRI
jgi:hypothetical protein